MSMHLRGSKDMMRNEDEGWWTSRTGLEQKLIILSTILFIVCFSLTITVIVYKNRSNKDDCTTVAPPTTPAMSSGTPVTGDTSPVTGDTSPVTGGTTPVSDSTPVQSSPTPGSSSTNPAPETSASTTVTDQPKPPETSESAPLNLLIKEDRRVNGVLEKLKEERLRGA